MASDLPRAAFHSDGEPAWKRDPEIRKHRELLVPDTIEWSGKRPPADETRYRPIEFVTPDGWDLRLPCRDFKKGRVISVSSCTGLGTPTMPFADHAWSYLELVEANASEYLSAGWRLARADFARDVIVPNSIVYLRDVIAEATATTHQIETHRKSRQLGVTFLGVAGGDRLRIYHKGLEHMNKHKRQTMAASVKDVVRVELQLRKGQLDERHQKGVSALRTARVEREPTEHDPKVMRLKPAPGHRIQRRHLHAMKRDRLPQRAVEATNAVNAFLLDLGLDRLLPDSFGVTLPEPAYGTIIPRAAG